MEGSFGTRLRSQREQQQVPLADIAERTKIKASLLEALERDDVSQWPTGIFRRSFVRAYAQAIGLDGDAVLREFLELYPAPAEEDVPAAIAAAREGRRPPTRLGYLISSAISALPVRRKAQATEPVAAPADRENADTSDVPVDDACGIETITTGHPATAEAADDEPDGVGLEGDPADVDAGWRHRLDRSVDAAYEAVNPDRGVDLTADEPRMTSPVTRSSGPEQRVPEASAAAAPAYAAVAELCTRLARAMQPRDVLPVLEDAARVLDAVGLIVWMWDPATRTLGHVLAHGYSHDVLSRLPRVRWETDNAIADAFRSADTRVVRGSGAATGAVVVPIVTGAGCAGVLAMELQDRGEEREWVRAVAAILAAQLAALFGFEALAEAVGA